MGGTPDGDSCCSKSAAADTSAGKGRCMWWWGSFPSGGGVGHHRTPVAASIYSFSLLSLRRTCVGGGSCCSLVTGLLLYPHTRGCYSPRVEGLAPFCLLLASAGSHTYQAILVLLPKLTNAPTKVHTGCLAHWGSGVY